MLTLCLSKNQSVKLIMVDALLTESCEDFGQFHTNFPCLVSINFSVSSFHHNSLWAIPLPSESLSNSMSLFYLPPYFLLLFLQEWMSVKENQLLNSAFCHLEKRGQLEYFLK